MKEEKLAFYPNSFNTTTGEPTKEMWSRLVAVGVDFGPEGDPKKDGGLVGYFVDIDAIFNQKHLSSCIYKIMVGCDDILGLTYSETLRPGYEPALKKRIDRIDDFIAKCKYKDEMLTDDDRKSIGILYGNRPVLVAKTVNDTMIAYRSVIDYAKHPRASKLELSYLEKRLAIDYLQNSWGYLIDSDFVDQWTQKEAELWQKACKCYKNQDEQDEKELQKTLL